MGRLEGIAAAALLVIAAPHAARAADAEADPCAGVRAAALHGTWAQFQAAKAALPPNAHCSRRSSAPVHFGPLGLPPVRPPSVIFTKLNFIILGLIALGAWMWRGNRPLPIKRTGGTPMLKATAQSKFPGFDVGDRDFVHLNGKICRVNADGSRHDLRHWLLDNDTGEFHRILKHDRGREIFIRSDNYERRLSDYLGRGPHMGKLIFALILFGLISVSSGLFAFRHMTNSWDGNTSVGFYVYFTVAAIFALGAVAAARQLALWTRSNIEGPEPLKRRREDFGPAVASSRDTRARRPSDLSYDPNA